MEQKTTNTQIGIATKVSTKTQILLGLMIVASITGMFALTIGIKRPSADTAPRINLSNMFNGTGTPQELYPNGPWEMFFGGSPFSGGIDDYNFGDNPPTDRYSATWTLCTTRNNYCGTGNNFAQTKDNNTKLIWSFPCYGDGCSSFSTATMTMSYYSWDNSGIHNNGQTAQQLCMNLGNGWYLPHQKQLLMAYIDGSYGNLEQPGSFQPNEDTGTNNEPYWSSTRASNLDEPGTIAWFVYLSHGTMSIAPLNYSEMGIRCVKQSH